MMLRTLNKRSLTASEFSSLCGQEDRIVLGDEESDCYWLVRAPDASRLPIVLLRHIDYHVEPQAYMLPDGRLVVGLGEFLHFVDRTGEAKACRLACRFYAIVHVEQKRMLIQHEIGFSCIDFDGNQAWELAPDLINNWSILDGILRFETFEGEHYEVEIMSGKVRCHQGP